MGRSRTFTDSLELPPYRPLTEEEAKHLASAGKIHFANSEQYEEFEQVLELLRCDYMEQANTKRLSLTYKQLRKHLQEARMLIGRLDRLLSDKALDYQLFRLVEDDDRCWEPLDRELQMLRDLGRRAELGEKLAAPLVKTRNEWAVKSARKVGLTVLLRSLVYVWQVATNTTNPQTATASPLVSFLREGARVIAQHPVDAKTASRWASSYVFKCIDLGYLLLRPVNDPAVVQYLGERGHDCLKGLNSHGDN